MNLQEANRILTLAKSIDNRKFDDATVIAWQAVLPDVDGTDALEAARIHLGTNHDYLTPAIVRAGALAVAGERERAAHRRMLAAQQANTQALPVVATKDRSAETTALILQLRDKLPDTGADVLHPRKAGWRKRLTIQRDPIPNPHFAGYQQPEETA